MPESALQPERKAPTPVGDKQRIVSLDIIRGAAVLGILLMNILMFGKFTQDQTVWEELFVKASGPNFWTYEIITVLFEGKMRALFCMLFGAGIMLFIQQKQKKDGKSPWRLFYFRMFWLVLFGVMHAHLLLWMGDILYFYGLFGMVVFLFRNMQPKFKALGVPIVIIIGVILGQLYYSNIRNTYLSHLDALEAKESGIELSEEQTQALEDWEKFRKENLPNTEETAAKINGMQGSYKEVAAIVRPEAFKFQTKYLVFIIGDNVALMLLGMALLQWGFFAGTWSRRNYRLVMLLGFGIGLPVVIFGEWYSVTRVPTLELAFQHMKSHPFDWSGIIYQVQRMFLALGHAAMLMLVIKSGFGSWLMRSLRAVGQTAFTNYIAQTVICTLIFFGYGFGLFNRLELYQLYFVVLGVWILEMTVSPIWLKRFRFGPLEWLWRSLTYWKVMPFRRSAGDS